MTGFLMLYTAIFLFETKHQISLKFPAHIKIFPPFCLLTGTSLGDTNRFPTQNLQKMQVVGLFNEKCELQYPQKDKNILKYNAYNFISSWCQKGTL